jgi:hypothetical protein
MNFYGHRFRFGKVATFSTFAEEDSSTDNTFSNSFDGSFDYSMASDLSVLSDGGADSPSTSASSSLSSLSAAERPAKQPRWMTTLAPAVRAEDVAGYEFHPPPRTSSITSLPLDIMNLVMMCSTSTVDELSAFSSVSPTFRRAAMSVRDDEDSVVWENRFKELDPVIHQCVVDAEDARSTWKARLTRILSLKQDIKMRGTSLDGVDDLSAMSSSSSSSSSSTTTTPSIVDVILYNHPSKGYLVNVGEVRRCVFVYGVREYSGVRTSADAALESFHLPTFRSGEPAPQGLLHSNILLLHSIDGQTIADHENFPSLVSSIRGTKDMSHWRLLFYPTLKMNAIPDASFLGGRKEQSAAQPMATMEHILHSDSVAVPDSSQA